MLILSLILILYVLPLYLVFYWIKTSHGEHGINEGDEFDMFYFWIMIIPILNIAGVFALWSGEGHPLKEGYRKVYRNYYKEISDFIGDKLFNIRP